MGLLDYTGIKNAYLGDTKLYAIKDGKGNYIYEDCLVQQFGQPSEGILEVPSFANRVIFYLRGAGGGGCAGDRRNEEKPGQGVGGEAGKVAVIRRDIPKKLKENGIKYIVGRGGLGGVKKTDSSPGIGAPGGGTGITWDNDIFYYAGGGAGGNHTNFIDDFTNREVIKLTAGESKLAYYDKLPQTALVLRSEVLPPAKGGVLHWDTEDREWWNESSFDNEGSYGLHGGGGSGGAVVRVSSGMRGGSGGHGFITVVWMH